MSDESSIVRETQLTIRRQLDRRGKSLKAVAFDSDIPYSTLLSYFPGERNAVPHAMSVAALRKLTGHIPPDLLSLLLPDGWQIVRVPEQVDHDELAEMAEEYLHKKNAAHHPLSEAGREIGEHEKADLDGAVVQFARRA